MSGPRRTAGWAAALSGRALGLASRRSRSSRLVILEARMGSVTVCALLLAACAVVHAASAADRSGDYSPPSSYADEDEIASAVPRGVR